MPAELEPLSGPAKRSTGRSMTTTRKRASAQGGGGGRDRTDDLKLAKLPLSQLSYAPLRTGRLSDAGERWWAREDLNFRPHAYQARALTN